MAESILSLSFAAQHIEAKLKQGSTAIGKVKSEVSDLVWELKNVDQLFVGAGGRTFLSNISKARNWAEELRRIAYEAEDEVDILELEATPLRLFCVSLFPLRTSKNLRKLKEQTREVKQKLGEHADGRDGSNRRVKLRARGSQAPKGHLPAAGDLVIGIDHEIKRLVDQLTGKSEFNHRKLAIIGMGGSGKTTLARSIYNNRTVKKHFHFQAWVSVTESFDIPTVLLNILKEFQRQKSSFSWSNIDDQRLEHASSKDLVSRINKILNRKTCLLVLDDVWDIESLHEFTRLIQEVDVKFLKYTIVITSRQNPQSRDIIKWHPHEPQYLTDEDSWKLFSMVASKSSKALGTEYRPMAMAMLRRCEGLPLAIVALGSLLKTKDTIPEWQRVLYQIDGNEATSMYSPVNEILGLSYDDLPIYLKPCFLYLGIFPEGQPISGGVLIRMWIAEGFVSSTDEETLEDAGRRYIQELVDHTMVQVVSRTVCDGVKRIRIHDIMRDFCILKAREIDFLTESSTEPEVTGKRFRRAAINLSESFNLPIKNSHLRSLALFENSSIKSVQERHSNHANQRSLDMAPVCQTYKLLRVLDIFGIKSPDGILPREIGNLIHLTYLRIRSTNIRELPKSIGKLRNLLTLDYWDVSVDSEIDVPNVLSKLERLRHLFLPNEMSGSVEDLTLHNLKDLVTLWGVGGGPWMLKEMSKLNFNLSKLYIHRISAKNQLEAVLDCLAMTKRKKLYALALEWHSFDYNVLNKLCTEGNLKKLKLIGRALNKPDDQEVKFPPNLLKLELCYTQLENTKTMMLLERLANLKVLRLSKDSYIGVRWSCGKEAFPVLEELKLSNLPILNWVIEKGALPRLKKLSIVSCIKLERMPEGLKHIQSLEKLEIERMPYKFTSRFQKEKDWSEQQEGEDYYIIEDIKHVRIRDI